jgi:hypothetical protein
MKKHLIVALTLVIVTLAMAAVAMAADPFVGTWKQNVAKSKYSPGPAPKSQTVIIEAQGNGFKYVFNGVDADGKATNTEFTLQYDGKDYPLIGDPNADKISTRRSDATTLDFVTKKNGKEVNRGKVVLSKDGKIMTATQRGKNEQGKNLNRTEVWYRQ